jgi:cytochrome c biogenesis protein CcdA
MKICPYCDQEFSKEETRCPWCGKEYWLPEKTDDWQEAKKEQPAKEGCLQILLMPLMIALVLTLFLITGGIIINLFVNFESNQIKIAWIVFSILLGLAVYFFLHSRKRAKFMKREGNEKQSKGQSKG